jgi:hypothetical protein
VSTHLRDIGGLAERLDLDCFHGCSFRRRPDCLDLDRRGPSRSPGFWYTGFAPVGDSANYGSEFFYFCRPTCARSGEGAVGYARRNRLGNFGLGKLEIVLRGLAARARREENLMVLCGFSRFGRICGRLSRAPVRQEPQARRSPLRVGCCC